jgi:small subunit ribosomal protein S3
MGQKTNPIGFRLPVSKNWGASWFANTNVYGESLQKDLMIRSYFNKIKKDLMISRIKIERNQKKIVVIIYSSRPSLVIKKGGTGIVEISEGLKKLLGEEVSIDVKEIKSADSDADAIANSIALQIEKRVPYLKAMKKALELAAKSGVSGVKICCAGRLAGADIARHETISHGSVSLQTIRTRIAYATALAKTTYGIIGIKVWVAKK